MSRGDSFESVDRTAFVDAMARAVNGVGVLTTDGAAGRYGITVSSFASVSADPPLVLVCVHRDSPVHGGIQSNQRFCVNLLAATRQDLANNFAGRPHSGSAFDFSTAEWSSGATGSPQLPDAVSVFDCVLDQSHAAGSHTVFIGRVVAVAGRGGTPLLYANRSYGSPDPSG